MGALTKRKEFEIRMRYELGEDLKALATIYAVPLTTLNKRKKQAELKGDAWIKGSRSKSAYMKFVENDEATRREIREKINSKAREELDTLQTMIDTAYKSPEAKPLEIEVEKAVTARAGRVHMFLDLRRKIEDIPTLKEEAEIQKIKIDIELKRQEFEDKSIELKIKRAEADMLLGADEK